MSTTLSANVKTITSITDLALKSGHRSDHEWKQIANRLDDLLDGLRFEFRKFGYSNKLFAFEVAAKSFFEAPHDPTAGNSLAGAVAGLELTVSRIEESFKD